MTSGCRELQNKREIFNINLILISWAFCVGIKNNDLCTVSLLYAVNWSVGEAVAKLLVKVKAVLHQESSGGGVNGVRPLTQHPDIECLDFATSPSTGG
jgi:hypothetical protein